jgi:Mce-associated membrane protein
VTARLSWRLVAAVLAVALIASLVGLILVARGDDSASGTAAARALTLSRAASLAEATARTTIVELTTYDYATIDADFADVEARGTAKFRKQYAEVSAPIRKLVVQLKARAKGSVVASAATAKDADHVTVLLFVDQELTNAGNDDKKLDQPRVTMKMVRSHGVWLVDQVDLSNLTDS